MKKICIVCGREFTSGHGRERGSSAKTCSPECTKEKHRRKSRQWYWNNPEKAKEISRDYHKENEEIFRKLHRNYVFCWRHDLPKPSIDTEFWGDSKKRKVAREANGRFISWKEVD